MSGRGPRPEGPGDAPPDARGPGTDRRILVVAALVLCLGGLAVLRLARPPAGPSSGIDPPACEAGLLAVASPEGGQRVGCVEDLGALLMAAGAAAGCVLPAEMPVVRPGDRILVEAAGDGICRASRSPLGGQERLALGIPIDLNRADATDLTALRGIGPVRAEAIVTDREANGPFATVGDVARVRGIGPVTVARITPHVAAEPPESDADQRTTVP
jgi:competence ComEA-like helix-hairpin-helix protein